MKGILFKPDMIQAVAEGGKTVTRRLDGLKEINTANVILNKQGKTTWEYKPWKMIGSKETNLFLFVRGDTRKCVLPRYHPGEIVYVKEAWESDCTCGNPKCNGVIYKLGYDGVIQPERWRSPLFMPAWAARYFIQIIDVRPERLQEITLQDCWDEGIRIEPAYDRIDAYHKLWDSINKDYPWTTNPFVWRYEFKPVPKGDR